jgi:putative salt-induced outer membrane protein YdiY
MMRRFSKWMMAATVAAVTCVSALHAADEVWLTDGSRLVGTLVSAQGGKLTLKTDFAGDLNVDAAKVKGIRTDGKRVVGLVTGDRVTGQLTYSEEAGQKLEQTQFGAVNLKLGEVTGMWAEGTPAPDASGAPVPEQVAQQAQVHQQQVAEIKKQHEADMKTLEERYQKAKANWTARIELGLTGQDYGVKEELAIKGRAEARRTTDVDRLLVYIDGEYEEIVNVRTQNKIRGGIDLEVDLTDRWFAFGKLSLEYDEIEGVDLRARVTSGLGYFLIREEVQELKVRGGVGYQHESFNYGATADDAVLELGYDYKVKLNDKLTFLHGLTYFPTFEGLNDYRIEADTALEIAMTDKDDWKVKLGVRNEYEGITNGPVPHLDTTYFLNLVLDIK